MQALSQAINSLLVPGDWIVIATVSGAILLWSRWQRTGRWVVSFTTGVLVLFAVAPLHVPLRAALESRFSTPTDLPTAVAGILVLGGASDPRLSELTGRPNLGGSIDRIVAAAELAHRFPEAKVVVAGGNGTEKLREADVEGEMLVRLGVARARLILERTSRNTFENVVNAKQLAAPRPGERWILVTSAVHMPRAVGVIRRQAWDMVPYPVDHTLSPNASWPGFNFNLARNLGRLSDVLHEWVGLIAYRMLDRSESLFPGAQS